MPMREGQGHTMMKTPVSFVGDWEQVFPSFFKGRFYSMGIPQSIWIMRAFISNGITKQMMGETSGGSVRLPESPMIFWSVCPCLPWTMPSKTPRCSPIPLMGMSLNGRGQRISMQRSWVKNKLKKNLASVVTPDSIGVTADPRRG
jgi:hypothetical protein